MKKSGHHYDNPTHEKRKRAKANNVQPGPKSGTTISIPGIIALVLSGGGKESAMRRFTDKEGYDVHWAEGWGSQTGAHLGANN